VSSKTTADEAPSDEQRVREWIERTLGARVVECERQARWRPAWYMVAERDGERLPLYFRGDRGLQQSGTYELEHEYRCIELLGADGIPVPRLYGFCDAPRGILMERAPGRSDLSTAASEAERNAVQDDYMRILADIHALDVAPFEAAGLARPAGGGQMALSDFPGWERGYRKTKVRPDPLLEFAIQWMHRNVPDSDAEVSFVCADSGQFVFEDGRVTAVLDLELAHLGDPAEDLAGLRTRDLSEPLGDLRRAVATYERLTGSRVDVRLVDYHTVRFSLVTPLATAAIVARPPPGTDLVQYLCWYWVYARSALEVIAHMRGISLTPPELPDEGDTRFSPAHQSLVDALAPTGREDEFGAYRLEAAARLAEYTRRVEVHGGALEAADLAEAADLLGERPGSWIEADRALEALVANAGPGRDAELLRFFHRRALRHEHLLAPVMRELSDVRIQMLD